MWHCGYEELWSSNCDIGLTDAAVFGRRRRGAAPPHGRARPGLPHLPVAAYARSGGGSSCLTSEPNMSPGMLWCRTISRRWIRLHSIALAAHRSSYLNIAAN